MHRLDYLMKSQNLACDYETRINKNMFVSKTINNSNL